jgi:transposase
MKGEFSFYVGIDWATQIHRVCVMDAEGQVLLERAIEHSGEAIGQFLQSLENMVSHEPQRVAVGIEVPHGSLVEAFLERNYAVFAINPKQLDRFRDRHSVAGAKDDRRDALVVADSLRTDQHCFRRMALDSPAIIRIRELSRTEGSLTGDLHRAVNQLYQLLLRYYPQILQLCSAPDEPWLWALVELAPTPQQGARLTAARLKNLLAKYRIRRWTAEQVREILTRSSLPVAPGVEQAVSEHVLLLLPQLRLLAQQRKQVADRTQQVLDAMAVPESEDPDSPSQPDVALLQSLPGVGRIITATMLAEGSQALAQRDYSALRSYAGLAPVTRQSGKGKPISMRYACNQRLRNACYHWARTSIQNEDRSKQHYARLRHAGHGHGRALRGVADRLLAVLIAMLKSGRPYDPARRSALPAGAYPAPPERVIGTLLHGRSY